MSDQTAIALSQEEWDDLAYICRVWRTATENIEQYTEAELPVVLRRRALADRVMEAV